MRDRSISVAVTADGVLRVWDCLSRYCLKQFPLLSLIQEVGDQEAIMEGMACSIGNKIPEIDTAL